MFWFEGLRLAVYAAVLVLIALRLLRTFAATPAMPVPSSNIVVGSGTVVIVPLKLSVLLVVPFELNMTCPLTNRLPVAPANTRN